MFSLLLDLLFHPNSFPSVYLYRYLFVFFLFLFKLSKTMRSLYTIFFCLLTALLYLSSQNTSSSSSMVLSSGTRQPTRRLSMSWPIHENRYQTLEVTDHDLGASTPQESLNGVQHESEFEEIVYHIDYQVVKTHPNPTPKHPKP